MKGKILIVDDDANMRESVSDNLEVDGYETAHAESAAEAVAQVKKTQFDVILMDYNLTDGTGIDAIKSIRALNADSQILMVTAHASLDTALKAIQESVDDFLAKPVNFDHLKRAIAKSLEKMRLKQDLKSANEKNLRLSAMKSKFMSMASHDLSNSLMTLQVSFEMLSTSLKPDAEQLKKMRYISAGIAQISRLIEDLVDWASIEQGKFRLERNLFEVGALVEETIVGPQARAAARGVRITAVLEKGLPTISADRKRLAQVLNNLLENAIRHTPKGGAITVTVEKDSADVRVCVRDTGDGIAHDEADKLFQSFYQGSGASGGGRLGLGLSISREIVDSHGGRIWVESEGSGKGAAFFFTVRTKG